MREKERRSEGEEERENIEAGRKERKIYAGDDGRRNGERGREMQRERGREREREQKHSRLTRFSDRHCNLRGTCVE